MALHLARALSCRVEDLFTLNEEETPVHLIGEAAVGQRLQLARVGERLCAYPLLGVGALSASADALLQAPLPQGRAQVEPLTPAPRWNETAVLCGCDPSLSLLVRHAAPQRILLRPTVSERSLAALVSGEAHAAGLHLYDPVSGESNLPFVAAALPGQVVHVYRLWSWEQGLIVRAGNPLGLTAVADLTRPGVRLANRPPGAGSRRLLDHWLMEAGLKPGSAFRLRLAVGHARWTSLERWRTGRPTWAWGRARRRRRTGWDSCRCCASALIWWCRTFTSPIPACRPSCRRPARRPSAPNSPRWAATIRPSPAPSLPPSRPQGAFNR